MFAVIPTFTLMWSCEIATTWDNRSITHDPVNITFDKHSNQSGLPFLIKAPHFGDPEPPKAPVGSLDGLWEYEVVEMFFLNDKEEYLEVEISPSGHYLLLQLRGARGQLKSGLSLDHLAVEIDSDRRSWTANGSIPFEFFPKNPGKFNAYAIHGSGDSQQYEALYPAPTGKHTDPDFHRLEYFKSVPELMQLVPESKTKGFPVDVD